MKKYIKPATKVQTVNLEMFLQTSGELQTKDGSDGGTISGQYSKESLWDDAPASDW